MPRYDYRCAECAQVFEITRPVGDETPVVCPECDTPAKRLFTPVGVVFKGSGFHNTDYRPRATEDTGSGSAPKTADGGTAAPCAAASDACGSCPAAGS